MTTDEAMTDPWPDLDGDREAQRAMTTDEAREALLAAWSLKEPTPKLAAFEAAVRAEYDVPNLMGQCREMRAHAHAYNGPHAFNESQDAEAKLRALRETAQAVVDALPDPLRIASDGEPIIDTLTVRSPAIVALRAALAATPAEEERT